MNGSLPRRITSTSESRADASINLPEIVVHSCETRQSRILREFKNSRPVRGWTALHGRLPSGAPPILALPCSGSGGIVLPPDRRRRSLPTAPEHLSVGIDGLVAACAGNRHGCGPSVGAGGIGSP